MFAISIMLAALACFAAGAVWYGTLSDPWMRASGVALGADGRPANARDPRPYLISLAASVVVAAMLSQLLDRMGVEGALPGLAHGAAAGAFLIAPWIALNNGYAGRPAMLSAIDGGYAVAGCAAAGFVLGLL
ncbi:MAG: DUF1761 domain-containing protein [Paracoccaceae bacterium]